MRGERALTRGINEFDADLRRLPPHDATEARRCAALNQLELIRNANGALDGEPRALFRDVADDAIDCGSQATETDLRAFKHAATMKTSLFRVRRGFHRRPSKAAREERNAGITARLACAWLAARGDETAHRG